MAVRDALTRRFGGFVAPQVRSDLRWELRALAVRIRTAFGRHDYGPGPHRLNIGAGTHRAPGWLSVDLMPGADIIADVRFRVPLPDASCSAIFCEHIIEHLRFKDEVPRFLAECRRLLVPGGRLRISVPDASLYLRGYVDGDLSKFADIHPWGETPMTTVNWTFHGYGHRFGWDERTLRATLEAAGFEGITRRSFGDSEDPELALDRPERAVESLYMEARVPGG